MKKFLLLLFFGTCMSPGFSQKLYFLYFQTEGSQAFFLRMDNKVVSSNAAGYLILPRLVDSTYRFTIGFPQNKYPEQPFTLTIAQKDHGFILKDFGAKGWGLFDLQTLAIIMNDGGGALIDKKPKNIDTAANAFTRILAKVSDDPSLLEKPEPEVVAVVEEKPVVPKVTAPVVVEMKSTPVENTVAVAPVKIEEPLKKDTIVVLKETVVAPVEESKAVVKLDPVPDKKKDSVALVVVEVKTTPVTQPVEEAKPVVQTEKPVADTAVVLTEKVIPVTETIVITPVTDSVVTEQPYKTSLVKKQSESSTTEGFGLVFLDQLADGQTDTIRLIIPNPKPMARLLAEPVQQPVEEPKKFLDFTASADTVSKTISKDSVMSAVNVSEEKAVVNPVVTETPVVKKEDVIVQPVTPVKTDSVVTNVVVAEVKTEPVKTNEPDASLYTLNKNCADQATDADFLKLRKRMAAAENNDDMIAEAKRTFKTKCFSTIQLKNLSTLFLDEEGKYHFFDEAYHYVNDPANFPSLQAELKEEYYVNRFKAMLKN